MSEALVARVQRLPCWRSARVGVTPLHGGLSNESFRVDDGGAAFVVRFGDDVPAHHVLRDHEWLVSRAAFAAGLSPEPVYAEPGVSVFRFQAGDAWTGQAMRKGIDRIVPVLRRCHREVGRLMTGPGRIFWVFHVLRDYTALLRRSHGPFGSRLASWLPVVDQLEALQTPMPIVFAHHDLLPGNIIDDGERLWLIDWEYGAFGTALFDLAYVAIHAGLPAGDEQRFLDTYFERAPTEAEIVAYNAMKVAVLLREAAWAAVSGLHLRKPGVDYAGYAIDFLERTDRALDDFRERYGRTP